MQIARVFAIALALAGTAPAAVKVSLTVNAGETARDHTPITATLTAGKEISNADADALVRTGIAKLSPGNVPVQVEEIPAKPEQDRVIVLRWIERHLGSNEVKHYELQEAADAKPAAAFHYADGDGYRDLLFGDQPIYRYMNKPFDPANRDQTNKPFHHVFGMHGEGYITKGPGGLETHHRGLFFGYGTQYGNFWTCKDVDQRHLENVQEREFAGPLAARMASTVNWEAKDGKPVVRDTREVTVWRIGPDETILDFQILVQSLGGDVQLTGDPHHGGFHFRAIDEVAAPTGGATQPSLHKGAATYIRPASAKLIKDDNWSDTPWVACTFSVKENPYLVLHMDDPKNPKPTTYSTRPYGRFGAFFKTTVKEHEPLSLRYRIILLDGKTHTNATAESLAPMYSDFVSQPVVTIEGK
jgi:hypothetical protein